MSKRPRQPWKIVFNNVSGRQFRALTYEQKQGVFDAMLPVLEADNPYMAPGVKKLEGRLSALYRVRAGSHRIIIDIVPKPSDEDPPRWKGEIHIVKIEDRKDVY